MDIKIGINGFGRIGRMVLRSIIENKRKDIEVVAINNRSNAITKLLNFSLIRVSMYNHLKFFGSEGTRTLGLLRDRQAL